MKTRKSSGHTSRLLNSTVSHEKLAFLTGRPSKSKSVGNQRTGKIKKKIRAVARKMMTEALSMVKLSSQVFRVFTMTTNNKTETEKNVAEVSAWAVCPLLATALKMTVDHLPSDIFTDIMNS